VDISIFFEEASNFITEGLKNDCCVFVHCREGKSRSIAMIIAHLMIQKNWTLEKAYQHVTNLLPWKENINQGFKLHLMNLDLKRQGIDKVSLDFYDRKNRRRTKPINYCEIDKDRQESQKNQKEKQSKKITEDQPMLSFESYWKQIAKDEQQTENTQAQNIQVLTTPDPVQSDTKKDTTLQSDNTTTPQDATKTNSDKSRKRAIFGTMNLEAIENNIEAHERKRKLKRKLSKSTNPDSDSTQTPITAPSAKDNLDQTEYEGMDLDLMETNMEVHRKRLKKRASKKTIHRPQPRPTRT